MVQTGRVSQMTLDVVPISGGVGSLGSWGRLELTGKTTAVLHLTQNETCNFRRLLQPTLQQAWRFSTMTRAHCSTFHKLAKLWLLMTLNNDRGPSPQS